MFAYPRRLALGIASLAALLLGLGLVALSATPALATACPSISFNGGPTLTDCSTSFTITQSGGTFQRPNQLQHFQRRTAVFLEQQRLRHQQQRAGRGLQQYRLDRL